MFGELLAVCHYNICEVPIPGAPPEVILNNSDHLFDTLRLIEPLILLDAGAVLLPEG